MKKYLIVILLAIIVMSCNNEKDLLIAENAALVSKLDVVSAELESTQKASATLMSAMSLMDSINYSRQMLNLSIEKSGNHEDFLDQMSELKSYIQQTSNQLNKLEKTVKESQQTQNAYAKTIKTLRADLESRKSEMSMLEAQLNSEKESNQKLVVTNNMQKDKIKTQASELDMANSEVAMLNDEIDDLTNGNKEKQADAFFTQGEAYALAAKRTQLAPKKKKSAYELALTSYQKAFDLGRTDAKDKIETIKTRLN